MIYSDSFRRLLKHSNSVKTLFTIIHQNHGNYKLENPYTKFPKKNSRNSFEDKTCTTLPGLDHYVVSMVLANGNHDLLASLIIQQASNESPQQIWMSLRGLQNQHFVYRKPMSSSFLFSCDKYQFRVWIVCYVNIANSLKLP